MSGNHSELEPGIIHEGQSPLDFPVPQKKFPWGCLIGGCLTVMLLMLGGLIAIGAGSFWYYKKQVAQYTSDQARELPVVELSEEEYEQIQSRVENFQEKVEKGEAPDQLILTADDLNALIARQENLRGRVFVTVDEGLIQAEVSIPTDAIPGAKGRYFNGSVSADASLEDGVLIVTLEKAEVNGMQVPEKVMKEIRKQNLARELYKDAEVAEKLRKFESLVIEGNRIILTPRSEPDASRAGEPNSTSDSPLLPAQQVK